MQVWQTSRIAHCSLFQQVLLAKAREDQRDIMVILSRQRGRWLEERRELRGKAEW